MIQLMKIYGSFKIRILFPNFFNILGKFFGIKKLIIASDVVNSNNGGYFTGSLASANNTTNTAWYVKNAGSKSRQNVNNAIGSIRPVITVE